MTDWPKAASGKLSSGLQEMISRCEGEPLKTYPLTYGKCAKCHAKTAWFCTGCKRWLCLDRQALQDSKKDLQLYHHIVRGKEKPSLKCAFMKSMKGIGGRGTILCTENKPTKQAQAQATTIEERSSSRQTTSTKKLFYFFYSFE